MRNWGTAMAVMVIAPTRENMAESGGGPRLLEEQFDVLDVAHDLRLDDGGARAGVEADGEALQAGGEAVAQAGAEGAAGAEEEPHEEHVHGVVEGEQQHGAAGDPDEAGGGSAATTMSMTAAVITGSSHSGLSLMPNASTATARRPR